MQGQGAVLMRPVWIQMAGFNMGINNRHIQATQCGSSRTGMGAMREENKVQ